MNPGGPAENRLLQLLPADERDDLMGKMIRVSPTVGEVIYHPEQRIESAYFPITAVAAFLVVLKTGQAIDSSAVGKEGMLGLPVLADCGRSSERVIWQVDGEAWRLPAADLVRHWRERSGLRQVLMQYMLARLNQVCQTCVCNLMHTLEERMCFWLLSTSDRVGADEFHLTQAFLADMLGVHRPTVSLAVATLQRLGYITCKRGWIKILDRGGLSDASCECYVAVKRCYENLIGPLET